MKALSLTQPWATLVATGAKRIETRSWPTSHRGLVAIHASKTFPRDCRELCAVEPFRRALRRHALLDLGRNVDDTALAGLLPLGAIVAVAHLYRVGRIGRRSDDGSVIVEGQDLPVTGDELEFGNYERGRYGWIFTDVQPLIKPIRCRGSLGLWDLEPAVLAAVPDQLEGGC